MISKTIYPLRGEIEIPGDKSVSHRAIMFGSLAKGTTEVTHFLQGADCLFTISCFQKLVMRLKKNTNKSNISAVEITELDKCRQTDV